MFETIVGSCHERLFNITDAAIDLLFRPMTACVRLRSAWVRAMRDQEVAFYPHPVAKSMSGLAVQRRQDVLNYA